MTTTRPSSPMFGGITIADLRRGHVSKRRNPLIADLFRRIEMVEAWGRGMPLIFNHEPDVEFREMADIFIAAFDRPSYQAGFEEKHSPVVRGRTEGEAVGDTRDEGVNEKVGEWSEKRPVTVGETVGDTVGKTAG